MYNIPYSVFFNLMQMHYFDSKLQFWLDVFGFIYKCSKTNHVCLKNILGNTTVPGPPASWNLVFLAKIPQDHSYISPGTIKIARKRPRGPLPGAFSFLSFFPKNLQFYEIAPNSLIFWPTIKCYTISESSCHTRRRAILVIDLVGSANE